MCSDIKNIKIQKYFFFKLAMLEWVKVLQYFGYDVSHNSATPGDFTEMWNVKCRFNRFSQSMTHYICFHSLERSLGIYVFFW